MRTDQEILDQTNELARTLYFIRGYVVKEGYRFDLAVHPHEREAWAGACAAQELLTNTDANDVANNLEPEEGWQSKPCVCGSKEDPWFSRTFPMGYFCPDCGNER